MDGAAEHPELYLSDGRRISREELKGMLPSLCYYAERGRLPDPDLVRKIREHPSSKALDKMEGMDFLVCHNCETLHYWHPEPHDKCGHMLRPLDETAPATLERVLRDITRNWRLKVKSDILNARYPLQDCDPFRERSYTCVQCGKDFSRKTGDVGFAMACSPRCLFACTGKPWPDGRKWTGFITLYPSFRNGVVLYLGTATIEGKECECYLWKMTPKAAGDIRAYYGNDSEDKFYESYWAGSVPGRNGLLDRAGQAIDESWRIVANTRKRYDWPIS